MESESFYRIQDPDKALESYLSGHDNLYGRMQARTNKAVVEFFFPDLTDKNVLEVGGAGGIWTHYFIERGAHVTCVDIVEPILQANKKRNPEAECVLGDAVLVQLDKKYDVIFAKDVIEHIENDMGFLKNMSNHLKDGGRILIATQNSWSLNFLIQGTYHYLKGDKKWCGWDPTHVRFYSFLSLRKKLLASGFIPEKWFGSYFVPYRLLADHFSQRMSESKIFHCIELSNIFRIFPISVFGWNIGVVAKKLPTAHH